jgi:hypothetical protein
MCAIIIAASKLRVTSVCSFNPLSKYGEDISDEDMQGLDKDIEEMKDEHSNDVDRMFPFGPTCIFNGIEVTTFITYIENENITSLLLTNMLQNMDALLLFDMTDGINPCLLCGGHGIRFKEPFLEYTLESGRPWTCCIGVPYGTLVWQVDDSVEQNDTFKIESKKERSYTVTAKRIMHGKNHLPASRQANKPSSRKVGVHSITLFWTILSYKRQRAVLDL